MFKWLKKIPYFEALRAFLEQWGVWTWITAAFAIFGGVFVTWAAWLAEQPLWAVALIGLTALVLIMGAANCAFGIIHKRAQLNMLQKVVTIDRDDLADKLEGLAEGIASLVTEHRGAIQEAWVGQTTGADRTQHARAEGRLIERFGAKYQTQAYMLIRRASKITQIDRDAYWRIEHGARSEHDLIGLSMFIAQLSDDVRTPVQPIPMYDPRVAKSLVNQPQLQTEIEEEKQH